MAGSLRQAMYKQRRTWRIPFKSLIFLNFAPNYKLSMLECLPHVEPVIKAIMRAGIVHDVGSDNCQIGGIRIRPYAREGDDTVTIGILPVMPTSEIKPKSEILRFLVETCGEVHDCEDCLMREECSRWYDRVC